MDDQKGKLRPLSSSGRKQTNFKKFTLPVLGEKHPFGSSARLVYDQHHHHQPQIPQFDGDTEYRHQHEHQHQRQPQYQPQYQQHHIDRKRTNSNGMYPSPSPSVPSQPTTQSYTIDNNNNNQNNYNKHNSNSNHSDSNNTNNSSNIKNNNLNNTSYTDVINSNDGNRNGNISQNANNNDSAQTQGGRNSHVGNHTSPSKFINQIRHGESLTQNSEYYQKTSPERYSHPLGASSPNHAHNEDGNNANGASDTNRIRSEHGNGRSGAPIKNNRNGFDNISDDAQARNHSRMVGETAKETRYPNPVYRNSSAAEKYYAQYPASPQSGKHVASAGYGFPSKQGIPLQDMRDMQLAGRDTERERDQDNHNHHHATGMRRRKASTRSDASVAGDDVQDKERDSSERTKALGRARTTNIMKVGHDKHGEYFYTMNNIRYRLHLTDHKSKTKSMANVTYNKRASQDFLDRRPDGSVVGFLGGEYIRKETQWRCCMVAKDEDGNDSFRATVLHYMEGGPVTVFITILVVFALSITLANLFGVDGKSDLFESFDLFLSCAFLLEILLRIYAMGPVPYFESSLCRLDVVVTLVDFLSILLSRSGFDNLVVFRVLRAARFTKISKISRLSYHAMGKTEEEEEAAVEKDFIGRIIGYDPDNLFSLGYMVNLSGTVLAMPEIWIQFVFLAILTAIWAANICKKRCDPGHGGFVPNDPECNGCVDGFESSTGLMFTSIVAFLLGLFDSMTFDRWWSTRIMLSNLLETSVNSAFFLANYVPSNDEVSVYCRRTIVRYLNLAFVLAFREMNEGNCEDNLKDLIPQYMTISEAKFLESESNKYSRVYLWACILLTRLSAIEKVMFPMRVVPMLHDQTVKQANLVATIKVYLQTQIPYTYTHLMTIIVKVHLLFVTAVAGTFVGQGIHDKQYITVVWGYLIILLSNTVFEGLLRIHVVLADPFGADACDFPMEMYNDYLWHESNHVLDLLNEGGMPQMPIELLDIDEILAPKRGDKDDVMDD